MIDIEKLAKEHGVDCVGDYSVVFDVPLDKLQKFAEAYHQAKCGQSEPVAWTDEHRNFLEWDKDSLIDKSCCKDTEAIPLFTSPQKPQPLKRLSDKAIAIALIRLSYQQ